MFQMALAEYEHRWRARLALTTGAWALIAVSGCTFDSSGISDRFDVGGVGCVESADCASDQVCACSQCVAPEDARGACGVDVDAGGDGGGDAGGDTATAVDGGDDGGFRCMSDRACGLGRFCDMESGDCLDKECEVDDDCLGDARCERFQCVAEGEMLCEPDSVVCAEDGEQALLRCDEEGAALSLEPCEDGERCEAGEGDARCVAPVCDPLEPPGCVEGDVKRCAEDGFSYELIDECGEDEVCDGAACVPDGPPELLMETEALPDGQVGEPYEVALMGSGGAPPYRWSPLGGDLPAGLALDEATGVLAGTPEVADSYRFSIVLNDASEQEVRRIFDVSIAVAALSVVTTELPGVEVGQTYEATLEANGGAPPYRWLTVSGDLPPGLTLSEAGVVSGIPEAEGAFTFPARVLDSEDGQASGDVTIEVAPSSAVDARQVALQGNLMDISRTGRRLAISDQDDALSDAEPIGFSFGFYGQFYEAFTVSTNGFVSFVEPPDAAPDNAAIPTPGGPEALVAVWWDDLDPASHGDVYVELLGVAPYRRAVVQWKDVAHAEDPNARINAQLVLYETLDLVQLLYGVSTGAASGVDGLASGGGATVGVENASGSLGEQVAFNQRDGLLPGRAWELEPDGLVYDVRRADRSVGGFSDISDGFPLVMAALNNSAQSVELGFDFTFYGESYSSVFVSSNGLLTFGAASASSQNNVDLGAAAAPNAVIAPFWDDLLPGDVAPLYEVEGDAPWRRFIVQWSGVRTLTSQGDMTFQVVLHETSNLIAFHYEHMKSGDLEAAQGSGATIGVEDAAGQRAVTLSFNQPLVRPGASAYLIPTSPDAADYVGAGPSSDFIDIVGTGSRSTISTRGDAVAPLPLDFPFSFYGRQHASVTVASDGLLIFSDAPDVSPGSNLAVPTRTGLNGFLAPFWDDLMPGEADDSGVYVETRGEAPNREFIVQWQEVALVADPDASLTFQVVLRESDGRSVFNYGPMDSPGLELATGSSATIGAENFDGDGGTLHSVNRAGAVRSGASVIIAPR